MIADEALQSGVRAAGDVVETLVGARTLRGAVVAAADADGNVRTVAVGSESSGRLLRPESRFLITSITKAITAIQVLRLVDRGLLDLWSRVDEHLEGFVGEGKSAVLVHHLLSHTSGLSQRANVVEGPATSLSAPELEAYAIATPLSRPPGDVEYCSPAFWLLSAILRRCVGRDHVEDLRRIVAELGIDPGELGYSPEEEPSDLVPAIAVRNPHLAEQVRRVAYPAGGVVATSAGLARFGAALAASSQGLGTFLSSASIATMARPWSRGTWPDGRPAVWGLGMELEPPGDLMGRPSLFHAGASGVGLWIDLERGVSLSLLTADWYLPRSVHGRVANAFIAGMTRGSAPTGGVLHQESSKEREVNA